MHVLLYCNSTIPSPFVSTMYCSPNKTRQFEDFVYLTQVVQMVCITAEIEHYRRIRNEYYTMGTLYWQLVRVIIQITIRCTCSCMYVYIHT